MLGRAVLRGALIGLRVAAAELDDHAMSRDLVAALRILRMHGLSPCSNNQRRLCSHRFGRRRSGAGPAMTIMTNICGYQVAPMIQGGPARRRNRVARSGAWSSYCWVAAG